MRPYLGRRPVFGPLLNYFRAAQQTTLAVLLESLSSGASVSALRIQYVTGADTPTPRISCPSRAPSVSR
jgi:hypothetical protein